jgi:hypothetical protein
MEVFEDEDSLEFRALGFRLEKFRQEERNDKGKWESGTS